ncbi:hypothetical protein HNP11_002218 [Tsukamurella ocularis]|nr:hypothetical protein [Tsukamurella ocularis]MCS3788034.1 hypothetical protein [Tsukamurella ocularis]MCS3852350.1 hypothetical protein [Tsukamurella ocularis]
MLAPAARAIAGVCGGTRVDDDAEQAASLDPSGQAHAGERADEAQGAGELPR